MAFTPKYTRANILTGQAQVYLRPYNPLVNTRAARKALLPANDVPVGGVWPAGWTAPGATEAGATMRFARETTDISIEEQMSAVDVLTASVDPRIELTLAEDTLNSMQIAYGGGSITTTAATTAIHGVEELNLTSDLSHFSLALETNNEHGLPRRWFWDDVLSIAEVETSYRRSEGQRLYATSFRLISPIEDVVIINVKPKLAA